jgi:hypothetical protein
MKAHVRHFETVIYASKPHSINMGVCSYEDELVISMSRSIEEKAIIETFYRNLEDLTGLTITYYSNEGD